MDDLLDINHVRVGERHRRDFGDLEALALSIKRLGLLHPIVVDADRNLVAGHRRLEACRKLGWPKVHVTVVRKITDAVTALEAERDETTCRKDFTPTEAVALGMALEELEVPKAAARRAQAPGQPQGVKVSGGDSPQETGGKTRDIVAPAVGMKPSRYAHAKTVVAAMTDPDPVVAEAAREAAADMDATGRVETSYRKVAAAKKRNEQTESDPLRRLDAAAAADRVERIREMAIAGSSSEQIAERVGLSRAWVKRICNAESIDLPADETLGRAHRIDPNRVAFETVVSLDASAHAIGLIQVDQLDATQIAEWATTTPNKLRTPNRFQKHIKVWALGQE
jgi:ParB family chromosome partitioning protein